MAADAARRRWSAPACTAGELDVIVLSTATPDRLLPSTAVDLQAELGATRAAAFDLSAACSGWLYGMTVAEGLIASGVAETVLVVGAEKMSAIVDWKDRSTCVLFGDGAGAVVLKRAEAAASGILSRVHAQRRHARRAAVASRRRRDACRSREAVLERPLALREDGRARGVQARGALDDRGVRSRARRRASSPATTSTC